MKPRYAVRADHDKQIYQVYEIATGDTVETFKYRNEGTRAIANGKANAWRHDLNETVR